MKQETVWLLVGELMKQGYTARIEQNETDDKKPNSYSVFVEQSTIYRDDTTFFNELCRKLGLDYYIETSEAHVYFWDENEEA